jgi:hypothetical protein
MRFANPADRRRAARVGIELPKSIYASMEHIIEQPPGGITKLPAMLTTIEVPEAVKFAAGAPGWAVLNPSIAVWNGELWCCVRLWEGWDGGKKAPRTVNVIGRLGSEWRPRPMRTPEGEHYEDLRLFVLGEHLAACGTTTDNRPLHGIAVLDLSRTGDIIQGHSIPSKVVEKNWSPCVDDGRLRFVYSFDPKVQVLDYGRGEVTPSADEMESGKSYLRGSSQLVPYEGGWLAIVHERHFLPKTQERFYLHRFVTLTHQLTSAKVGRSFYFRDLGIEFCAGLAFHSGRWIASFGYRDKEAMLAMFDDATVKAMMVPQ